MHMERIKLEEEVDDTLLKMSEAARKGITKDEVKRTYKVLSDEEFPEMTVQRLMSQPSQLHDLYGSSSSY